MCFICTRIKNHFHINGFTLSLALKQRLWATHEWPILIYCGIVYIATRVPWFQGSAFLLKEKLSNRRKENLWDRGNFMLYKWLKHFVLQKIK